MKAALPADYDLTRDGALTAIAPRGDWTALSLSDVPARLERDLRPIVERGERRRLDAASLGSIDTAGAIALVRAIWRNDPDRVEVDVAGRDDLDRLRDLVGLSHTPAVPTEPPSRSWRRAFAPIGLRLTGLGREAVLDQAFVGRMIAALARTALAPRRLRPAALASTMQQAGFEALPIVFFLTFFIGAILALVGSTMLRSLGVEVYTVEMVGIGVMREFGVVVAGILFAGRSASAFAAQLGAMRMAQETDAMEVMGVDLFDALVVPRVLAALLVMPIMTVIADLGGLIGGMLVAWLSMDISPAFFARRLVQSVGQHQFWVGLSKAPFFALAVAATGCRHGLAAEGNVGSLGVRVTQAVVQSIFMVIMFDAIFAILLMQTDQ